MAEHLCSAGSSSEGSDQSSGQHVHSGEQRAQCPPQPQQQHRYSNMSGEGVHCTPPFVLLWLLDCVFKSRLKRCLFFPDSLYLWLSLLSLPFRCPFITTEICSWMIWLYQNVCDFGFSHALELAMQSCVSVTYLVQTKTSQQSLGITCATNIQEYTF